MKVVFLYTEVAAYFLKCCETLAKQAEIHVIRWPVNKEAPFDFKEREGIKLYTKTEYSYGDLKALLNSIQPDVIVCSGWIDKEYLKLCKPYFRKIPTVLTCDTHWTGSLKQYLAVILSRVTLLRIFSHAWVPGDIQTRYVLKLGFKANRIQKGFYCCDLDLFNQIFRKRSEKNFPLSTKRFLYVGRYYDFKGLPELWTAFIELQQEEPNDWELWCLGTGSLKGPEHKKIKHFGFVQPKNLEPILLQSTVFILPSRFEPWAVVVQEMAAAGFPLVLSNAVGAGELFLKAGENGFMFDVGDKNDLKMQLKKVIHLSENQLKQMSEHSHHLAQEINPERWAQCVMSVYHGN
jgi:glycosyltransferase involved in cell wall biosynthesis